MTIVEGDQKAPFSIATTPRCREGRYSFPMIAPLYPYIAECSARRYQVPFLVCHSLGLNPGLPDHWRTLYPQRRYIIHVLYNRVWSMNVSKLIKIIESSNHHRFFKYNNAYYQQKFGLPMRSPLCGVVACLSLQF